MILSSNIFADGSPLYNLEASAQASGSHTNVSEGLYKTPFNNLSHLCQLDESLNQSVNDHSLDYYYS